jgi:hypothetical protein
LSLINPNSMFGMNSKTKLIKTNVTPATMQNSCYIQMSLDYYLQQRVSCKSEKIVKVRKIQSNLKKMSAMKINSLKVV